MREKESSAWGPSRFQAPVVVLALLPLAAMAQLAAPNAAGVAMGHLHFFVEDVGANRDFWVGLGGSARDYADGEVVSMPGVVVWLSRGQSRAGPSVLDHVAFRVASLEAIAARGFELEMVEAYPGIASVYTPAGDRVELFEEGTATNVGFAAERPDASAGRHNRPLNGELDSHHLHYYLPEEEVAPARDWYSRHFGAVPGMRWRYDAADLPGMNLNFSTMGPERAPSRGHALDHVGFEVRNLEAFCARLTAAGIEFDEPFRRVSDGFAVAVLTDPWGVTLELTEGLGSVVP
jgi:catechol 2,3-dioxygenase-like lactoylglutathione lyase family enzyme